MRLLALMLVLAVTVACEATTSPSPKPQGTGARTLPPPAQRSGPVGSEGRPLVMALMPSQDAARTGAAGRAIAGALEKATGLRWQVTVPASYSTTIEGMCAGETDIGWMAPLATVTARAKNCAEPLVAGLRSDPAAGRAAVTYQAQLLVRANSGITKLADLKGKRIALVQSDASPTSLALLARVRREAAADPRTFFSHTIYQPDDEKAALALYQGQVEAAATIIDARDGLERTYPDVKRQTTLIATIGGIPNDGISSRRGLPADVRDKVQKALIDYSRTEEGKRAIRALYPLEGLDDIDAKLYDPLLETARA
ncbi:MAG: phosphate/phosphite/phosphonate ABC transporter substrate-binding protein, partial [Chloroflexi bacterium]|nr:phosphate/phosphite/phosphonate ABC transporter substrate-binding protein [Chloroflexota bacterium]